MTQADGKVNMGGIRKLTAPSNFSREEFVRKAAQFILTETVVISAFYTQVLDNCIDTYTIQY